jgi:tetratricopeptide (TPR) repeat protein
MLLFLVFKRMTGKLWRSAFVAVLFALHPLNVESVAWLAERKNVLSTFFWLLTMLSYIYYSKRPNFNRYLLILFVFVLGLMSKPMLVTLPFVLLMLDYWPLCRFKLVQSGDGNQETRKSIKSSFQQPLVLRLVLEKIPLLSLSALCIYLSSLSVQRLGIVISTATVPMKHRIANALVSYVCYIKKMMWPNNLAAYYPYPQTLPLWQVAGAGLLLVCISFLVFRAVRSKPYLVVGWLWYIGTLVPAIGLVQAGLWPAMADRFAYVPLIGLFIVIAWGVPDLVVRWHYREIKLATIAVALLAILMATTYLQVGYWRNSITLFKHALDVTYNNHIAHHKLGEALAVQGKTAAAARHYTEALRIKPDFFATHLNLGIILRDEGKLNEAIDHFSRALHLKPDRAEAYFELGITLEKQGSFEAAIRHYLEVLQIKPDYAKAQNNLGVILSRQKKDKKAIFHFYEAIRIDPDYAEAYYNLGIVYAKQRNIEIAILHYKKALYLNPNMAQALYNLSWILASCEDERFRNGEEAVKLAEKLCKLALYNQPLALDALAAAYAETGRFDEAVTAAKKALGLAFEQGPNELVLALKKRLQLYQAGRPYRQTPSGESSG